MQNVSYAFLTSPCNTILGLLMDHTITTKARVDVTSGRRTSLMTRARHLTANDVCVVVGWEVAIIDRLSRHFVVWMIAWKFFLSANLCDRGRYWSHINICNLNSLVIMNLKRFVDNFGRAFYSQRFLRRTRLRKSTPKETLLVTGFVLLFFRFLIIITHRKEIFSCSSCSIANCTILSSLFIKFNGRKKLSFSQKSVNLSNKFQSSILFIQNKSINRV